MEILQIALAVDCILSEGPGRRFALWVQGCERKCQGCGNPYMWDKAGGISIPVMELIDEVDRAHADYNLEGITIIGGEPFLQEQALVPLLVYCGNKLDLSVIVFTGYTYNTVKGRPMLRHTDLLVSGPYLKNRPETKRHWVGSTNQRFCFLTNRYQKGIESKRKGEKLITPHDFHLVGKALWRPENAFQSYRKVEKA